MKKRQEEPPKGSPAWMATFSDLMNLLLCFFVLLFAMSSVDSDKWAQITASLSSNFSIFQGGQTSIEEGSLINSGISQLSELNEYYRTIGYQSVDSEGENTTEPATGAEENGATGEVVDKGQNAGDENETGQSNKNEDGDIKNPNQPNESGEESIGGKDDNPASGSVSPTPAPSEGQPEDKDEEKGPSIDEQLAEQNREQTGAIYDELSKEAEELLDTGYMKLDVDNNNRYVQITINGQFLFESGKAELNEESLPYLSKLADILMRKYSGNYIEVIGHTDNVPVTSRSKYGSNDLLSSARAISMKDYLVVEKGMDVNRIMWCGKGEHEPVASNTTAQGRAQNRRVEIRIYNELNSY